MTVRELKEAKESADGVERLARFQLRPVTERAGRNGAGLGPTFENGFVVSHARSVGRGSAQVKGTTERARWWNGSRCEPSRRAERRGEWNDDAR